MTETDKLWLHRQLLRICPRLDRIDLESVENLKEDKEVVKSRGKLRYNCKTLANLFTLKGMRTFIQQLLRSKLRVQFNATTWAMKYQGELLANQLLTTMFK